MRLVAPQSVAQGGWKKRRGHCGTPVFCMSQCGGSGSKSNSDAQPRLSIALITATNTERDTHTSTHTSTHTQAHTQVHTLKHTHTVSTQTQSPCAPPPALGLQPNKEAQMGNEKKI